MLPVFSDRFHKKTLGLSEELNTSLLNFGISQIIT